jgi:hypothetical protein
MADQLFTDSQKPLDPTSLSPAIRDALSELERAFPGGAVNALWWNNDYTAIRMEVDVDLPSRGPVRGVDIREREPIFLLLHRRQYPYRAPLAYPDRADFPASRLPHMIPGRPGGATKFCLLRGNFDSYFAEHSIVNVVERVRGWLRDAAGGLLIRPEDGFEPIQLSDITRFAIYDPSRLISRISEEWRSTDGAAGFLFLWYKVVHDLEKDPTLKSAAYAIRLQAVFGQDMPEEVVSVSADLNRLRNGDNGLEARLFGILAWPQASQVCPDYFASLPTDILGLSGLAAHLGIPLDEALEAYSAAGLQLLAGVPLVLAVPRPQRVLFTDSATELMNLLVVAGDESIEEDGTWSPSSPVWSMGHRFPLTAVRARELSSQSPDTDLGRLLVVGCGAVGSKFVLHLARAGQAEMTLVDHDSLAPHNLVRHGLGQESLAMNKAEALQAAIVGMYKDDATVRVEVVKDSALDILLGAERPLLEGHEWLIDATASAMVRNLLSEVEIPDRLSCCRCEIADGGRLGLMGIEGAARNPRIDDLQVMLFDMALERPEISAWLRRNAEERQRGIGSRLEDINIGLGCSSDTMRLADDVVSLHAATMAASFRHEAAKGKSETGVLLVSLYEPDASPMSSAERFVVPALTVLRARNAHEWQIRMRAGLATTMMDLLACHAPDETGGLLIGLVNLKRRIIHVTRILPAPPDSQSSPYAFVRGVQDLPEDILDIHERSGGLLGWVGEWHTHPEGGPDLSQRDLETVDKIRSVLETIPLPTQVMVVTPAGVFPHVFEPRR